MRWLIAVSTSVLTGCASFSSPPLPTAPAMAARYAPTVERPWLMPEPTDEITLFDTRMLRARRDRDGLPALNANGTRDVKVGMWVGIGLGAAFGLVVADKVTDAADDLANDTADSFFECLFDVLFGDDCEDED